MRKLGFVLLASVISTSCMAYEPIEINLGTYAHQYAGLNNTPVYTTATHDIQIVNNTDSPKTFNYSYSYCGDLNGCVNAGNTVTVQPHSKWNNHHDSYLTVNYIAVGNYNLTATTSVWGEVQKNYSANGSVNVR